MKSRRPTSIDGFIPRRPGSQLGELHISKNRAVMGKPAPQLLHTGDTEAAPLGVSRPGRALGRSDIDESLRDIDSSSPEQPAGKMSRRKARRLAGKVKKPRSRAKRIARLFFILLLIGVVAFVGYFGYKLITASDSIFKGGLLGLVENQPLKEDSNGRSNFLILGTSEDDPGHPGGNLTDSMMIVSIDQKNKNVYMFSIPRDLYVQYGQACASGYSGKINVYFSCSNDGTDAAAEQDRLTETQKFVGKIFGMDIQYGIHVNNTVIKDAVDAVGGVDVNIKGDGDVPYGVEPGSILDRNFDWRCGYKCFLVKYSPGVHHLDGEHALFLSMARGDSAPTYGLVNSNFDREVNQQKIIVALKEKATSTGTLTNLSAVTKLIDTLGTNLRTNIQTNEIRTLMQFSNDLKPSDIHSISLFGSSDAVVTTATIDTGESVVRPIAGLYDYSDIQAFIKKNMSTDPIVREDAHVVVLNGTGENGVGQAQADKLTADGYDVSLVSDAPDGTYQPVEIYQIGTGNTATATKLADRFHVVIKTTGVPVAVTNDVSFVIVFGTVPK